MKEEPSTTMDSGVASGEPPPPGDGANWAEMVESELAAKVRVQS